MKTAIKNVIVFALLLVFTLTAHSQTIKWQQEQKSATDSRSKTILGANANGVYLIKSRDSHPMMAGLCAPVITIEKYDYPNLQREYSKELLLTEDGTTKGPEMYYDGIYYMKDNILLLMYGNDASKLYGMKVNTDGSIDNNKVEIGTVAYKSNKGILSQSRYRFAISKDKTALLTYYVSPDAKNKLSLKAIDENAKELWSKDFEDPYKGKKISNIISAHSLTGQVIYLIAGFGDDPYHPTGYGMFIYNHTTGKASEMEIKLDGVNSANLLDFDVDNSGNAVIAGYYGNDKSKETSVGSFNLRVNDAGQSIVTKTSPFDKDFMAHIVSAAKVEKGKGIDKLGDCKIKLLDDGTAIVLAEQGGSYSGTTTGGSVIGVDETFDVVVANIGTDGSIKWAKSVAKKQACHFGSESEAVCSYSFYISAKNVYIIYNDSKKNASNQSRDVLDGDNSDLSIYSLAIGPGNPVVACESIDIASGEATRSILVDEDAIKLRFFSDVFLQLSPDTGIIYAGSRGKNEQFGTITLK